MANESKIKKSASEETLAETEQETPKEEVVALTEDEFRQVKERIDKLEAERDEMKQLAQRVQADFDNFRKRNVSIHADSLDEGIRNSVTELLPVMDNFELALNNADNIDPGWLAGIQLVYKQLMDSLKKLGLEEIPADGKFDPEVHNAVMQEEVEGAESGDITGVLQKGYRVKNRIIRHSMVKVAK